MIAGGRWWRASIVGIEEGARRRKGSRFNKKGRGGGATSAGRGNESHNFLWPWDPAN